jgi:hypothetical protein
MAGDREQPRPYRQGDLDGLCGVYCTINAIRLAILPHQRLDTRACERLFDRLIRELAGRDRLRRSIAGGLSRKDVAHLLARAARWLDPQYGLRLIVERPPRIGRRLAGLLAQLRLADHLTKAGVAIVSTHNHWTVVRGLVDQRLIVFDSHGRRSIRLAEIAKPAQPAEPFAAVAFLLSATKSRSGHQRKR